MADAIATDQPVERESLAELLGKTFDDLEPVADEPQSPANEPAPAEEPTGEPAETPEPGEPAEDTKPEAVVVDIEGDELSEEQLFQEYEGKRAEVDNSVIQKFKPDYDSTTSYLRTVNLKLQELKDGAVIVEQVEDPTTGEMKEVKKARPFLPDELDLRDQLVSARNRAEARKTQIENQASEAMNQARVPVWCDLVVKHDKRFAPVKAQLQKLVANGQHQRPNGDTLDKEDLLDLCLARYRRENPGKTEPPAPVAAAAVQAANAQRAAASDKARGLGTISAGKGGTSPVQAAAATGKKDYAKDATPEVRDSMNQLKTELTERRNASMRRKARV